MRRDNDPLRLLFPNGATEHVLPGGEKAQPVLLTAEMRQKALRDLEAEDHQAAQTLAELQQRMDALPQNPRAMSIPEAVLSLQMNDVTLLRRAIAQDRVIIRLIDEINALHAERGPS